MECFITHIRREHNHTDAGLPWKSLKVLSTIIVLSLCVANEVRAATLTETIYWKNGAQAGKVAGTCIYTIPDNKPLSVNRTLVLDNSLPVGTTLYTIPYAAFLHFTIQCGGSGLGNDDPKITTTASGGTFLNLGVSFSGDTGVAPYYTYTNNSGIAIKYTFMVNTAANRNYKFVAFPASGDSSQGLYSSLTRFNGNVVESRYESGKQKYQDFINSYAFVGVDHSDGKYYFTDPTNYMQTIQSFSVMADLIKIGDINYNDTPLKLKYGSGIQVYANNAYSNANFDIGGGGIKIVRPTCKLDTKNYTIPMSSWVSIDPVAKPGAFPAYGSQVPVNITMQCSGKVDDTQISFEDANSLTTRQDVGLYDSAGGSLIDGLAVQLLYKNAVVPTDNTKLTISGLGSTKSSPDSTPLFNSLSTINFNARYVQTAAIKKNGANYTGPVVGKVNIWVTYN
ncbi:hypothetical protein [Metakosakonia massiliensis]|uniref:Fimbrial-type adhesion domain-containing protein n=1 Tax=Phytobacter massiliensis TaxID=1485952 RepID=A0A6N3HVB3_9ENTR